MTPQLTAFVRAAVRRSPMNETKQAFKRQNGRTTVSHRKGRTFQNCVLNKVGYTCMAAVPSTLGAWPDRCLEQKFLSFVLSALSFTKPFRCPYARLMLAAGHLFAGGNSHETNPYCDRYSVAHFSNSWECSGDGLCQGDRGSLHACTAEEADQRRPYSAAI